jgi:hypothetical protein
MRRVILLTVILLFLSACAMPIIGTTQTGASTAESVSGAQQAQPPERVNDQPAGSWPLTTDGILVFNDQLTAGMGEEWVRFSATHYAGVQKMTTTEIDRLQRYNSGFILLNYRLGIGLGYRAIENGCQPSGDWLYLIEGDNWVHEWPGDSAVQESWFYHWPEGSDQRVINCDWGWYMAELSDPGWRAFWQAEVLRQVQATGADGVFMDSLNVPNYMGWDRFDPQLPEIDEAWEQAWSQRIEDWLAWLQTQPVGDTSIIVNVGNWINSRDITDYSAADGVMIEQFALEADVSPWALSDWQLQMDRALNLITQDKIVIAQSYATGSQERMYALGSYLLIRGDHTYINIELGEEPEWWPEYDIPIGSPQQNAAQISDLYDPASGLYSRQFTNGIVLVNPTNPWDGTGMTTTVQLDGTMYQAMPSGGGMVAEDGTTDARLDYEPVTSVELGPYTAVVLLYNMP